MSKSSYLPFTLSCLESGCSDVSQVMDAHQSCILGSHAGSLHQELLVTKLHTIQPSYSLQRQQGGRKKIIIKKHSLKCCDKQAFRHHPSLNTKLKKHWLSTWALQPLLLCWTPYLVVKVDINIFAESVSFRQASGTVLHQVEGLQGAKWCQQLLHLEHKRLRSKNQA